MTRYNVRPLMGTTEIVALVGIIITVITGIIKVTAAAAATRTTMEHNTRATREALEIAKGVAQLLADHTADETADVTRMERMFRDAEADNRRAHYKLCEYLGIPITEEDWY